MDSNIEHKNDKSEHTTEAIHLTDTLYNYENDDSELMKTILAQLETVFDPEFPLIDVYTMGLFYGIIIDEVDKIIDITMTYTTPACPAWDLIQQMIHNALNSELPEYTVEILITFDPQWKIEMIRDKDLQRMFE